MKEKKAQVKPKKSGGKNSKNTPMAPEISSIITQNELKKLFETTKNSEYELISSKYSKKVSDARDKKFAAQLFYNNLSGEFQEVQQSIYLPLVKAREIFFLDKNLEMIDAFLIFTEDKEKIICLAKFEAMDAFFNVLNNSEELNSSDDEQAESNLIQDESSFENQLNVKKTEFTIAQQCLAIYYLLLSLDVKISLVDKSNVARMIHLLAGKNVPSKISNSDVYKRVSKLLDKSDKGSLKDLDFVLSHFRKLSSDESIRLNEIMKLIEKDINSYSR